MRKHLRTSIEIDAPATTVWAILTDHAQLRSWNDFVLSIQGEKALGARWTVRLKVGKRMPLIVRPRIVEWTPDRAFRWVGRVGRRGIFDGEHGFVIEPLGDDRVRFVHEERFSGVLVRPILWLLRKDLRRSFEGFNRALKARAEAIHVAG